MSWYVELEFLGELRNPEDLDQAAEGAVMAHYQEKVGVLRLRALLDAAEYEAAMSEAMQWPARLPGAAELVNSGALTGPDRVVVETSAARSRGMDLVGAAEIAERFGISTTRVRQIEKRPDFPGQVSDLKGGRIYRADEVDQYGKQRNSAAGRPREDQSDA
ncbi:hypothetical protein [Salinispora arenicola]|uniref:hypothetical protein n=1 Tax=Salinispora arenicola TaxID=168697 RepID=UPI00036039B0|nr:hypothetical protein [Salinispora arenicola]